MDYSHIGEVKELSRLLEVETHLGMGWILLGVSPGQSKDGNDVIPYFLYSVGRPSR